MGARAEPGESARIESFSDAVFGFALTLLVVSLEVPSTFEELRRTMEGFLAFAICFAIIVWIWVEHRAFFRRFPIGDGRTVALNSALLFVVLFYVYPLKFLFQLLVKAYLGLGPELEPGMLSGDGRSLMRIYSLGFTVVFLLLAALYAHAWRRRDRLGLGELERHDARAGWIRHVATACVGIVSLTLAYLLPERLTGLAGWVFGALGPVHGVLGARQGRVRAAIVERAS